MTTYTEYITGILHRHKSKWVQKEMVLESLRTHFIRKLEGKILVIGNDGLIESISPLADKFEYQILWIAPDPPSDKALECVTGLKNSTVQLVQDSIDSENVTNLVSKNKYCYVIVDYITSEEKLKNLLELINQQMTFKALMLLDDTNEPKVKNAMLQMSKNFTRGFTKIDLDIYQRGSKSIQSNATRHKDFDFFIKKYK